MPLSDEELAEAREAIRDQFEEIREDLEAAGVDVSGWDDDHAEGRGDDADTE